MNKKPWALFFFSLFFLFSPLFNLVYFYQLSSEDLFFYEFIDVFYSRIGFLAFLFTYVLPAVLATLSIFLVKSWSLPLFFIACYWELFQFSDFFFKDISLPSGVAITAMTVLFLAYSLLLPKIREIYFNPRLRWWESKPRYKLNQQLTVFRDEAIVTKADICNFSEGGLFISSTYEFAFEEIFQFEFSLDGNTLLIEGLVAHADLKNQKYGIMFTNITHTQETVLKKMILHLNQIHAEVIRPRETWGDDLKRFVTKLKL
jgi:hypothetical protein